MSIFLNLISQNKQTATKKMRKKNTKKKLKNKSTLLFTFIKFTPSMIIIRNDFSPSRFCIYVLVWYETEWNKWQIKQRKWNQQNKTTFCYAQKHIYFCYVRLLIFLNLENANTSLKVLNVRKKTKKKTKKSWKKNRKWSRI